MANTYTQLYIHVVFAAQFHHALIAPAWKERLHQYMTGILLNHHHAVYQINSMPDHIHILMSMHPDIALSDLMSIVKSESTKFIQREISPRYGFRWQRGFGAFSVNKSGLKRVIQYIANQEAHHSKVSFLEEYESMLREFEIAYDRKYIFSPPQ